MTRQASSWGSFVVFIVGVWGINQAVVIKARGRCCFGAGGLMDVWRKTGHPAAWHKQARVFRSARWDRGLCADYTPPRQEAIVWINWAAESSRSAAVGERGGSVSWPTSRPLLFVRVKCVIIWRLCFSSFTFTPGGTIKEAPPITAHLYSRAAALAAGGPHLAYF